jgi:hypothetical protein
MFSDDSYVRHEPKEIESDEAVIAKSCGCGNSRFTSSPDKERPAWELVLDVVRETVREKRIKMDVFIILLNRDYLIE